MKIRDIVNRDLGNFYRFRIHNYKDKFTLTMERKLFGEKWGERIAMATSANRLTQLANDILTFLNQKAKIKDWKPTNEEYECALERKYGKGGMNFFVIDWVRKVVALKDDDGIKQARLMYEWLKSNEEWLYKQKLFKEGSKSS